MLRYAEHKKSYCNELQNIKKPSNSRSTDGRGGEDGSAKHDTVLLMRRGALFWGSLYYISSTETVGSYHDG